MKEKWWNAPELVTKKTLVIVQRGLPLSENETTQAFKGSENTQWYRALIQLIETYRVVSIANSASACGQNNALAVAAATGAHEVLGELLADLHQRAESD